MVSTRVVDGSGEEILQYVRDHPGKRFQLMVLTPEGESEESRGTLDPTTWQEILDFKKSLKGKMGALPLESTSTEALYD